MFRRLYPWMFLLGGVLIGLIASGRIILHAQEPGRSGSSAAPRPVLDDRGPLPAPAEEVGGVTPAPVAKPETGPIRAGAGSAQDVLLRPYHFPFPRPTSLSKVCLHLKETLGISVVLDIAALDRQDVKPDDTVQLELDGVRLKTGLKLLLDQVGLTYQVVAEDNLLIITDREGSEDPLDRIWTELRNLHRDLHDVQDAVDELTDALYGEEEEGPKVRKPTIIEEKPDDRDPTAPVPPGGAANPPKDREQKPGTTQTPKNPRGGRSTSSRVPL